ncbi:MAG: hypothetical protein JW742_01945, partial [Candidatus Aminicenantes bacterium]|nr:hypothetical protein [Candidatus Aminicenantes bacterium]
PVKSVANGLAPAGLLAFFLFILGFAPACKKPAGKDEGAKRVSLRSSVATLEGFEAEPVELEITVRNEGRASLLPTGESPVLLSYHLLHADGRVLRFDNPRTPLPGRIAPGREAAVKVRIKAPLGQGGYGLEFDLLREGNAWFKDEGSRTLTIPLEVRTRDWTEDRAPFQLSGAGVTRIESSVADVNRLFRLIRITLRRNEVAFAGRTGEVRGFFAGGGYPQIWLRDAATIIPASRNFYGLGETRSWLVEHLARQRADGGLEDWIDAGGGADKNTVETDQEASAVLAAYETARLAGVEWLREDAAGSPAIERLDRALDYVYRERRDERRGLITGAHTADWGDVEIVDADQSAIYAGETTHWTCDIYDQAMFVEAARALAVLHDRLGDEKRRAIWNDRAEAVAANANRLLWQEDKGFYRMHIHLDDLTHEIAEEDIFAMGGNVQAVRAGIADGDKAARIFTAAVERQARFGVSTVSGVLLPPYPAGFFKHPGLDEPYEYQNGGQWDWFGGKLVAEMFRRGMARTARAKLLEIAAKNAANLGLHEWEARDGAPRGSDFYSGSAGSLALALIEGYFGVRLDHDALSLEPRLGTDSGRIRVDLPACGRYAAYDYAFDAAADRITLRFASNVPGSGEIRILSPWPMSPDEGTSRHARKPRLEAVLDGRPVSIRLEREGEDDLLVIATEGWTHALEILRKE